jgi:D-sedoheptulose 7-phosphate isomerase
MSDSTADLATYLKTSEEAIARTRETLDAAVVERAIAVIVAALAAGRPLLVCGNGGSASDAMHITGELVGRFLKERRALKAICLSSNPAVLTAWANDYDYDSVFSRQVEAYAEPGGVILGLSTSGNSKNVIAAFELARARQMATVALTGQGGGKLAAVSDVLIDAPSQSTPIIQQIHICLYHYICEKIEARLAG